MYIYYFTKSVFKDHFIIDYEVQMKWCTVILRNDKGMKKWWNHLQGKQKYCRKTCPSVPMYTP